MRYFNHLKIKRRSTRLKKSQKKYSRKTIRTKSYSRQVPVHLESLEDINEILRIYRTHRASVKGNWKVVPKDSCEIYRERKRRQIISERRNRKQSGFDKRCEDHVDEENIKLDQRKHRKKSRKKTNKKIYKKNPKHNKRKHRQCCTSSVSSYDSTSITTLSSISEMDLD